MNKELENDIELIESRENPSKAFQATEQPLDLVALSVHFSVVFPNTQAIAFRRDNRCHTEIKDQLASFIAFIGFVHDWGQARDCVGTTLKVDINGVAN